MKTWLGKVRFWRILPFAAFVLFTSLVVAAGFVTVRLATNNLLETEAAADARNWSNYLTLSIDDLPNIVKGIAPTPETRRFLDQARSVGRVHSFRVYDNHGRLQLRSDGFDRPTGFLQSMATTDSDHTPVLLGKEPKTILLRGRALGEPAYYASTVLPINENGERVGWIVTKIDQTERQANFFRTATIVSLLVGALLVSAPLIGFFYRSRQKREAEKRLKDLSRRDLLTGLDNHQTFTAELDRILGSLAAGQQAALILLEVADFGSTSQNYGAAGAERQIITTAERLSAIAPATARFARLDAGRFGLVIENIIDHMSILSFTKELANKLSQPVSYRGDHISTTVHAGIALSKSDGADTESLLHSADLALGSAQEQGSPGYGFFNPEIAQDARRRIAVQRAVAEATANGTFRLDFQPLYHIKSGELSGFEALIRLNDPELGPISPAEFIPIAEQAGLINKIGAWCLQEACRIASSWPPHLVVAVNLSPAQFYSGTLIADVQNALQVNRFPSYRLEVEITEGTLLKDSELVLQQLSTLRETGVAIALDDFGTGYSSLSYLWKFPFSKLKIDRSFVNALGESQSARGILRSIIKLGHGLGLTVTAEGIENNKQFATLRDLGCDLAQGYLLDRPARVEDLAGIILRNFAKGLHRRPAREQAPGAEVIPLRGTSSGKAS